MSDNDLRSNLIFTGLAIPVLCAPQGPRGERLIAATHSPGTNGQVQIDPEILPEASPDCINNHGQVVGWLLCLSSSVDSLDLGGLPNYAEAEVKSLSGL